jgi:phosphoribosylanthranilate isomerase
LNATNVAEAIETVQPFGIDVCSGVRINGNLDEEKLTAFFKASGY